MMALRRVYHRWDDWEEVEHNMWGEVDDRQTMLQQAVEFTGKAGLYGSFMRRVILEWPISCENALTDPSLNRKAWIGHAASALALGCPEDITRKAWSFLDDEQRTLANREANRAIQTWEDNYRKGGGVCEDVGAQMLFGFWDS